MTRTTGWSPEEEEPVEAMETPADEERSTAELLRLLIAEGRDYATTEMDRQKLRARLISAAARDAALLGAAALFLLMGMLVALLVGGIWVLAPYVGPLTATLIVLALCAGVIALLLLIARSRVRSALRCLSSGKEQP